MRWLNINAYFPPEIGSASVLFYELGKKLVERGHTITCLTGFPRYNVDIKKLPSQYRKHWYLKEEVEGMKVVRIRTLNLPRYIPVARGVEQFVTSFLLLAGGLFFLRKKSFDRILVYSPYLPLGLTALIISKVKKAPFVLNVQDLFPQSAIDLGILKNRFLIRFFEKLEKFIYERADMITVHSEGNRKHVLSKNIEPSKVVVVPNWIDTDAIKPDGSNPEFRKEFGLKEDFIVSFAGVIGYSQDLDTIIESAVLLRDMDITFLIVGDGVEKERLRQKAREYNLNNVVFLPMQPQSKYPGILAASDACLVTLHKTVKTPVVPSKLLSIMAAGKPVVASLPLMGDAPKIIIESDCGICVDAGQPKALAEAVRKIYSDKNLRERFGKAGRKYAEDKFSLNKCLKIYENLNVSN